MIAEEIKRLSNLPKLNLNHLLKSVYNELFLKISSEIASNNPRQILYHAEHGSNIIPLCDCGINNRKWHIDKREYRPYCGPQCAALFSVEKVKSTNLKKYGVEWPMQLEVTKDKSRSSNKEKYGVDHFSKTSEYQSTRKRTNLKKYGVEHPAQNEEVKKKTKQTNNDRYGVDCTLQSPSIAEKAMNTNIERYGGHPFKAPHIKQKIKDINMEKYGVPYTSMVSEINTKRGETRIQNHYSPEVLGKINDPLWLSEENSTKPLKLIAEELGEISPSTLGIKFKNFGIIPNRFSVSSQELKLYEYFKTKGVAVETCKRELIYPKEIDLYFPESSVGVEINGLYWHSSEFVNSNAHADKSKSATSVGIKLLHFTDWEINNQWDIVISKITNAIGITENKLYARKLHIKEVLRQEKKHFLKTTHIQGNCNSSINVGLYHQDELVMLGTFGKSRYSNVANWELLRLSSKLNTNVVGGASKILSYFIQTYMNHDDVLISYSQIKFGQGNVYYKLGFEYSHSSKPGFFYVRSGLPAGNRESWQKHKLSAKLELFDPTKSEEENMRINGYYRYYDCGQHAFIIKK